MLVDSGGVVALVIGAWSVLWVVVATPERRPAEWYPVASAFVAAMFAFALLSAESQVILGMLEWFRSDPVDRPEIVDTAMSYSVRPLVAPVLGSVALAIAAAVGGRSPAPRRPKGAPPIVYPGWPARLAVGGLAVLTLAGLGILASMRRDLWLLAGGGEPVTAGAPRIEFLTTVGATISLTALALAVGIGAMAALRRFRAAPAS